MERVFLEAPIPVSELKRKFTEEIEFVINVKESKLKGKQLIVYLSNLDIAARLQIVDIEEGIELALAYMKTNVVVSIPELEDIVINLLLAYRGMPNFLAIDPERLKKIFEAEFKIIELWLERIQSLLAFTLYIQHTVDVEKNEAFRTHQDILSKLEVVSEEDELVGLNYVNLIKHGLFAMLLEGMTVEKAKFNEKHFSQYIFSRKNLLHYFSIPSNPLFLCSVYSAEEEFRNEVKPWLVEAEAELKEFTQELQNVPYLQ